MFLWGWDWMKVGTWEETYFKSQVQKPLKNMFDSPLLWNFVWLKKRRKNVYKQIFMFLSFLYSPPPLNKNPEYTLGNRFNRAISSLNLY